LEAAGAPSQFGVIFDFDGTLMDSFNCRELAHIQVANILADYGKEQGFGINEEAMVKLISDIDREMSAKLIYDREVWFSEAVKRYCSSALKVPKRVLSEAVLSYWNTIIKYSLPYPGAVDLLVSLKMKNTDLGMLSDTDGLKGMKCQRLCLSGLVGFFDAIVVSGEDTKETKPNKHPFIKICNLLKITPANCVYVGDNPEVDVAGAKQIGMKTILIRNSTANFHETKFKPDFVLARERFSELELLIGKLLRIDSD
jgi:HAD superfamily hydrolase (TIGR01549 family)